MNWTTLLLVALLPVASVIAQEGPQRSQSPREQYDALVEQYEQLGGADQLAEKFLELAHQNALQPVALDALGWILINVRSGETPPQARQLLLSHHLQSEQLGRICMKLAATTSLESEVVLRTALDKSSRAEVQAAACFSLAAHLQNQLQVQESLLAETSRRRRLQLEQYFGRDFTRHVRALDKEQVAAEVDQLYDRVVKTYGQVDPRMTDRARTRLTELRYLSVGKTAREIEGEDVEGVPFKLSDYRGNVVMLTFWGHW